jgi:pyrroline-5-carboxylate reductase
MQRKIAIIGGGNLGQAIAEGLLASTFTSAEALTITRRNITRLANLAQQGVTVTCDNAAAAAANDVIILAVKPFQAMAVLTEIQPQLKAGTILVSVVTGVQLDEIAAATGNPAGVHFFRAMPNTAIAIRESMTCICSQQAGPEAKEYIISLFNRLGQTVVIEEKLMEAATVLGACGTAYAMRYIRANIQGGIEIGFDAVTAAMIAAQTVKGAAELLLRNGTHPEQEIDKVTTPKGCTIAGLNEMEHRGFSSSLIRGVVTSYKKIAKEEV